MAKNRSGWWLTVIALLVGVLMLGLLGLVCGLRSSPETGSSSAANNQRQDRQGAIATSGFSPELDEVDVDGFAADGLSLVGRVIYADGRPAIGANVRLLSRPSGAPHASMSRRVVKT